jgi:hypothetical protein
MTIGGYGHAARMSVFQRADERPLVPTLGGKVHNLFGVGITSDL